MSISDLYTSGAHKRNLGHFSNLVKLALADDIISEEEQVLINRMKRRLNITEKEYAEILINPNRYPLNPPASYEARIERLYNLTRLIVADHDVNNRQIEILERVVVGLGFSKDTRKEVVEAAFMLVEKFIELDEFTTAIKKINKI
ncbi:MAG: TerB family tellurite resistance protein [Flavobacteriales bacterium]